MTKSRRVAALLTLADADLEAALALADIGNRYAAYHCQQGAEKLVKAVLLDLGVESGAEHRIDVLLAKLPNTEPWKARLQPLERLTPFATTFRYPTPGGRIPEAPDAGAVKRDIAIIESLLKMARSGLLSKDDSPR